MRERIMNQGILNYSRRTQPYQTMFIRFIIVILMSISNVRTAMEGYVFGGEYAVINDYPHLGLMIGTCGNITDWLCSSSILNQKILLTAAHCLLGCKINPNRKPFEGDRIAVYFGSTRLEHMSSARVVDYTNSHVGFDELTGYNDIALVLVRKDIPLGDNVKRVVISKSFPSNALNIFFESYVAGWGMHTSDQEGFTNHLRQTYQKVRTPEDCSRYGRLYKGMFCAGRLRQEGGDHPAQGDSGGALVTRRRFLQIGIISFGWVLYPAMTVYTNTSYHFDWIESHARMLYCRSKPKVMLRKN